MEEILKTIISNLVDEKEAVESLVELVESGFAE